MSDRTTTQIIDREFLELRARVLELAASFDRIERATGDSDERVERIQEGMRILLDDAGDKARRVQELFSRDYLPGWREEFQLRR